MIVTLHVTIDPTELIDPSIDSIALTGLGPDGTSEYEVTDISYTVEPIEFDIDITIDRVEGKFVSKTDIADEIIGQLEIDGVTVDQG